MNERFDDFSRLMATHASRRGAFKFTLRTLAGAGLLLLGAKRAKAAFACQESAVPAGTPANRVCGNRKWCAQAGSFCCVGGGSCICCDAATEVCVKLGGATCTEK
jgi:hypothetical protein